MGSRGFHRLERKAHHVRFAHREGLACRPSKGLHRAMEPQRGCAAEDDDPCTMAAGNCPQFFQATSSRPRSQWDADQVCCINPEKPRERERDVRWSVFTRSFNHIKSCNPSWLVALK